MTPAEEKVHFDTFGFIIRRGLFGAEEMQKFSHWFDEGCDVQCGPFTGERQMGYPGLSIHEEFCHRYLDDPRILDTLENLMGEGFMLVASDAQRHSGNSHWHQDTAIPMEEGKTSEYLMLKVIMYLDDHSEGPGCLWVLPGSHKRGYAESIRELIGMGNPTDVDTLTPAGVPPTDFPGAIPTKTRPGDIIFFNQKLAHSSWGGQPGRRFLGLTFGAKPTEDWQVEWLVHHGERWKKMCRNERQSQFPEHLVRTAGPRRQHLIEFMYSRGY